MTARPMRLWMPRGSVSISFGEPVDFAEDHPEEWPVLVWVRDELHVSARRRVEKGKLLDDPLLGQIGAGSGTNNTQLAQLNWTPAYAKPAS
jgi:hypothetical protein